MVRSIKRDRGNALGWPDGRSLWDCWDDWDGSISPAEPHLSSPAGFHLSTKLISTQSPHRRPFLGVLVRLHEWDSGPVW